MNFWFIPFFVSLLHHYPFGHDAFCGQSVANLPPRIVSRIEASRIVYCKSLCQTLHECAEKLGLIALEDDVVIADRRLEEVIGKTFALQNDLCAAEVALREVVDQGRLLEVRTT